MSVDMVVMRLKMEDYSIWVSAMTGKDLACLINVCFQGKPNIWGGLLYLRLISGINDIHSCI